MLCVCAFYSLLSGASVFNDRVYRRWQIVGTHRGSARVRVVGARAVRCPCPHRGCAAWAVSVWCAVEPDVARRSDREADQGIKGKQGASWRLPHAAKISPVSHPLFFFQFAIVIHSSLSVFGLGSISRRRTTRCRCRHDP
jgi:hypothetical protein